MTHVLPEIFLHHVTRRALEVHDSLHPPVDGVDRKTPPRLEEHLVPFVAQPAHKLVDVRLKQRLAPGDFDEAAPVPPAHSANLVPPLFSPPPTTLLRAPI